MLVSTGKLLSTGNVIDICAFSFALGVAFALLFAAAVAVAVAVAVAFTLAFHILSIWHLGVDVATAVSGSNNKNAQKQNCTKTTRRTCLLPLGGLASSLTAVRSQK